MEFIIIYILPALSFSPSFPVSLPLFFFSPFLIFSLFLSLLPFPSFSPAFKSLFYPRPFIAL